MGYPRGERCTLLLFLPWTTPGGHCAVYLGDGATEMREYDWSCLDLNHVRDLPVFFRLF